MTSRQILMTIVASLVFAASALSIASADQGSPIDEQLSPTAKVSLLGAKSNPTQRQTKRLRKIQRLIKRAPSGTIIATAAAQDAMAVRRAPGLGDAWVIPADDGSVCTFIPDPIDGYASSCATKEDMLAGGSITALAATPGSAAGAEAQVVVVVPDQSPNPSILRLDGTSQEIPITANVGSATVEAGERIIAGSVQMTIPELELPDCESARPRAAASRKCAG